MPRRLRHPGKATAAARAVPRAMATAPANLPAPTTPPLCPAQEDLALIISNTKRRPRVVKERSPSGYGSG